jgi:beta-glucanase (GH16 family)
VRLAAALVLALAVGACAPGTPPYQPPPDGEPDAAPDPNAPDAAPQPDAGDLPGYPWNLIWQDEFEGEAGARPDQDNWLAQVGTDWGNQQLEFDTDRTDNAALDGEGHLVITARRESFQGRNYTSARLATRGRFQRQYGRFEARMKLPRGQGMWPAFWLLGTDIDNVGWPNCGEIDVMENRGQQMRVIRGSLHGPGYSAGANHGRETDVGVDLGNDFHTYVVEWDPGRVIWKVDDHVYFTATPADLPAGKVWVYDHPFYVILNVAVGGNFVGNPDGSTQFPQQMVVDYVRAYERIQ